MVNRSKVKRSSAKTSKGGSKKKTAKSASSVKKNKPTAKKSAAKKKAAPKEKLPAKAKSKKKAKTQSRKNAAITKEKRLLAYREMVRARLIDQKIIILYKQNKCHFQIGVAGHECVQVAAAMTFRVGTDWFYPYYRDMALVAGLGMSNEDFILNALNKDADPNSHGRQMPMHYGDVSRRIVNQSSPTGTQFLQAVGCALGAVRENLDEVVYVSAGEGTCSQGDFHEALNWAARDKLPVVFLIQNNGYAISVPIAEQLAGGSVAQIASGYENLKCHQIDGTDLTASLSVLKKAHDRARKGKGPTLIEASVPRLQSHSISDNHLKYRSEDDLLKEQKRCPIAIARNALVRDGLVTEQQLVDFEETLQASIDAASNWAEAQADPSPESATYYTLSDSPFATSIIEQSADGPEVYMVDAINHALAEELARDEHTFVFGQDVAHGKGGVFTVTAGLTEKFGNDRVFNSQLAESSIVGTAIGMATRGLKPIAEIQFGDYIWTAMMQIRNELAMMRYRSGGDFTCPAVIRVPVGGYIHGAAYHSQCIEGTFAHFPGLQVLMPSNATDAKGLLKTAIRSDDPVLFLEHKGLYRQVYAKGPEGDADHLIPFGKAKVVREGSDISIITYGAMVHRSFIAAQHLAMEDVSVEVLDLRSIVPLDYESIFASVKKTSRVLVVHEDVEFMGFGAEIIAQIAEFCFEALDAPIRRVGMQYAAAVPHAPVLEDEILPQMQDVLDAARELLIY